MIGCSALLQDMGVRLEKPSLLRVDSTACLGMSGRRGAGRIRHITTPCLWLQRAIADGRLELEKVDGKVNPADLGTKVLPASAIQRIVEQIGFVTLKGKSRMALKAAVD